jgi:HK97 gp10 family phage protein
VPKFKINLNPREIDRLIKDIKQYKRELTEKVNLLIGELTDYGVEVAKAQVRELGAWYTGELESSIKGYFSPSVGVGIIKAGAPYAVYVEFGTGIVGKGQPHPSPDDWRYDINEHGESGWWYFNDYTGHPQWTKGMPSRPFMYNTARELENACERIAREVFGR